MTPLISQLMTVKKVGFASASGEQIAALHQRIDAEIAKRAQVIAADYTPAELARFVSLMHRIGEIRL